MAKPTIITRAGKGSALTWTEGDTNLTNLRDATITVSDGSNTKAIDLNGTIQFAAGSNATVAVNSSTGVVTISASGSLNTNLNYAQAGGGSRVTIGTGASFPATIVSVSITTTGGPVLINAYGDAENTGAGYWSQLQLYRGTTALGAVVHTEGSAGSENSPFSLNYIDNPSAGTYTYYLKANNISGGNINYGESTAPTINVTELKGIKGDTGSSGSNTITVTDDITTDSAHYLTYTSSSSGSISGEKVSVGKLQWNPGVQVLSIGGSLTVGAITGTTIGGTTITASTQFSGPLNGTVGATTPSTGAFTTLSSNANTSFSGSNAAISLQPTGTGYVTINPATAGTIDNMSIGATTAAAGKFTNLTFTNPREAIYDLGTTGGTIAPNCTNGSVQKITLNSALTINGFTSPVAGQSLTLIIYGGTAYTSITSTMKFAGGIKTLTATSGCIDILTVYYDGTTYFASLGKGFA